MLIFMIGYPFWYIRQKGGLILIVLPQEKDAITLPLNPLACLTPIKLGSEWHACNTVFPSECTVYSYGINQDWSFESALLRTAPQCIIHGFDPSVDETTVQAYKAVGTLHLVGLGPEPTRDYPPRAAPFLWPGIDYLRGSNTRVWRLERLRDSMDRLNHNHLNILKIDVEGAEWFVDTFPSCNQLLIELHFDPNYYELIKEGNTARVLRKGGIDYIPHLYKLFRTFDMWRLEWNGDSCLQLSLIKKK